MHLDRLRIEFTPCPPTGLGGQPPPALRTPIAENGAPTELKAPGGFGFGAARLNEVHHSFAPFQRIRFHIGKVATLGPNVYMK